MPPWRTIEETRAGSRPVSLATIASASSADLRCCASKSGGTYSASMTGVSGRTFINRMVPPDSWAIMSAVAGRPAYTRKMAWLMPRMAKAVPYLGYIIITGTKPA